MHQCQCACAGCSEPVVLSQLCFTTSAIALPRRVADIITSDIALKFCKACFAGQIQRSNNRNQAKPSQAKVETVDLPWHRGNHRLSHGKLIGRHNLPPAVQRRLQGQPAKAMAASAWGGAAVSEWWPVQLRGMLCRWCVGLLIHLKQLSRCSFSHAIERLLHLQGR
jgi:hypothetical protein